MTLLSNPHRLFDGLLLDPDRWAAAGWSGVTLDEYKGFAILMLRFDDELAGRTLFRELNDKLDTYDEKDILQISLIRDEDGFFVSLTVDASKLRKLGDKMDIEIPTSRTLGGHQHLYATEFEQPITLDHLEATFERRQICYITPTGSAPGRASDKVTDENLRYSLVKRKLKFKDRSQLTTRDPEYHSIGSRG